MPEEFSTKELFDLMQRMWNPFGLPVPDMLKPSLSVEEVEKKLTELKAVETWLQTNLGLLQMTIKTLELQRSALQTMTARKPEDPAR
jgi:hypothetical protein